MKFNFSCKLDGEDNVGIRLLLVENYPYTVAFDIMDKLSHTENEKSNGAILSPAAAGWQSMFRDLQRHLRAGKEVENGKAYDCGRLPFKRNC